MWHPLDEQLAALPASSPPGDRMEIIWQYYEANTGQAVDRPPTESQRDQVRAYLQESRSQPDGPMFYAWPGRIKLTASLTLAEKAGFMAQAPCGVCETVMEDDGRLPLDVRLPINIEPWSSQSRKDKVKIRKTVAAYLAGHPWMKAYEGPLCVTVVSVLGRKARVKDADNLTKGLLDSMQNNLFGNDRQIQCMTSRVVKHQAERGYYLVTARAVHPWDADVVGPGDIAETQVMTTRLEY